MKTMTKATAALILASTLAFMAPAAFAVSGNLVASPSQISPGGTVTLTVTVQSIGSLSSVSLGSLEVCQGGSISGCGGSGLTAYYLGNTANFPTITCTTGPCDGTWTVDFASGTTITCAVTLGTGSCSASSATVAWGSGASTSTSGSYGVVGIICSPIGSCSANQGGFSVDTGFSTPEFGLGIAAVVAVGLVGMLALRKRSLGSLKTAGL